MPPSTLQERALFLLDEMGQGQGPINIPTRVRKHYWEDYASVVGIVEEEILESSSDLILQKLEQCTQQAISLQAHTQAKGVLSCLYFPKSLDCENSPLMEIIERLNRFLEHFSFETTECILGIIERRDKPLRWACLLFA